MVKITDIIRAGRDYFDSRNDAKSLTTLDLKSIPFQNTSGMQSPVRMFSSLNALDRAIGALWSTEGTNIDYGAEVGDLRGHRLVMSAVNWLGRNLASARLQVITLGTDEKETEVQDHDLVRLFKRPNPYFTGRMMWKSFAVSWIIDAMAYFLKFRDGLGQVSELWYEPSYSIRPRWYGDGLASKNIVPDDGKFISFYEVARGGEWLKIEERDVLVFRDGLDPETRRGFNGISSAFRTLFTDREREQYTALLLKNCGVSPLLVAPKNKEPGLRGEQLAADLQRRTRGDERGKPTVFDTPMEVLKLGTDFMAESMEKIMHLSESAFCSVMGISAQSLRFDVSHQSSSYNNMREFRREDYESYIMPLHDYIGDELTHDLLPEFSKDATETVQWNYDKVPIAQRDRLEVARETDILVKSRVIDQAEARERHGYNFDDDKYKDVWYPVPQANTTDERLEIPEPVEPVNDPLQEDMQTQFGSNGGARPM